MSRKHIVQPGECMGSIARLYGFLDPASIYDHADNGALRKCRGTPDILAPGDKVVIPPKRGLVFFMKPGEHRTIVLKTVPTRLHLKVCTGHDFSFRGDKYELRVDGIQAPFKGELPKSGELDVDLPATARRAELDIFRKGIERPVQRFDLDLGGMDPVDTLTGVQARLEALGYDCGGVDGELTPLTRAAIRAFQRTHGLLQNGDPKDAKLQKAL